jgi:hypothetical protein
MPYENTSGISVLIRPPRQDRHDARWTIGSMSRGDFGGFMRWTLLVLALFLVSHSTWAQVTLQIPSAYGAPGSKVIVPIMLSDGRNITAIQLDVNYDPSYLTIPSDQSVMAGELVGNQGLLVNRESGRLRASLFSGSLSSLKSGGGCLLQIIFQLNASATLGSTSTISIAAAEASDSSASVIPLTVTNGVLTASSMNNKPSKGQNELIFPHFSNGDAGGNTRYTTTMILVNRTDAPASAVVSFYQSPEGSPYVLTLAGVGTSSTFELGIPGNGSICLPTDGTGSLASGFVRVASTAPLGGSILFTYVDSDGNVSTEAGVGASAPTKDFSIPVLYQPGLVDTGIAIANPSLDAIDVTVRLLDVQGNDMASSVVLKLAGNGQKAWYVSEHFPVLKTGNRSFDGTLRVTAPSAISAVAVKGAFGGRYVMTTFPLIPK